MTLINDWESEKTAAADRFQDNVGKNALYLVYIFIGRFAVRHLNPHDFLG